MFELPVSELGEAPAPRRRRRPKPSPKLAALQKQRSQGRLGCCSLMRCSICCIAFFLMLIPVYMFVSAIFRIPEDALPAISASRVSDQGNTFDNFAIPTEQFDELDRMWTAALAEADVEETIQISHMGLAKKYVFLLEGGFVAMAKPVERDLLIYPRSVFGTLDWHREQPRGAVRMDREYQGWGELAGLLLDRVLGMRRKPPIVGRYLPSELLYRHDYSLLGRLLYALPNRQVPVSMHAWVHGMSTRPPSNRIGDILRRNITSQAHGETRERMLEYADVLVFDFLVDDHDRFGNHNWKAAQDGLLLVWDSGLAWNYGPAHQNLDILCGTHQWNKMDPVNTPHYVERPDCKRICIFRRSTIDLLRSFGRERRPTLGEELKDSMEEDVLHPIFNYGMFNMRRHGFWFLFNSATRFEEQNFFDGIDERVTALLDHVDDCIEKHGARAVLQSLSDPVWEDSQH